MVEFTAEFWFYLIDVVLRFLEVAVQKVKAAAFCIGVEVRVESKVSA